MQAAYSFKKVFIASCMGMLFFGMTVISLGSILPDLIAKFSLDEMDAGILSSLLPSGILLGALVFGPVVDRYSYRNLLIVCGLLVIMGLEGIAFANNFFLLEVAFFLIGFGGGAINGGVNALVADISMESPQRRSANLSLLGVFFGLGALLMPFLLGLFSESLGYEDLFFLLGLVFLLVIAYFLLIRFPDPKQPRRIPWRTFIRLTTNPNLLLLGFLLFFQSGLEGLINNWVTVYLQAENALPASKALYALTVFVGTLTLGRILLANLLALIRPYLILTISVILSVIGALLLAFFPSTAISIVTLVLFGLGAAAGFPIILSYAGELYPDLSGTAFSLVMVIGLIGSILFNYVMGVVAYRFDIEHFSILLLVASLSTILLLGFTLRKLSRKITV